MARIHITESGKAARCTASLRECPRGASNHFDSMRDAAVAIAQREAVAQTSMGSDAQQVFGSEMGILVSEADFTDALESRELSQKDFAAYLQANGHLLLVDALRAKLRVNDANGWSDWADAGQLTPSDKHQIALREVAVDADKWRDEVEDRLRPSATGQYLATNGESKTLPKPQAPDSRHRYGANSESKKATERAQELAQLETAINRVSLNMRVADRSEFMKLTRTRGDLERQAAQLQKQQRGIEAMKAHRRGKDVDPAFLETLRRMYLAKFGAQPEDDGVDTGALLAMFNRGELG